MKRLSILKALVLLAGPVLPLSSAQDPAPPVRMKPVIVRAGEFELTVETDATTKAVKSVTVSMVVPGSYAAQRDLRPGDRLIRIDRKPVTDYNKDQIDEIYEKLRTGTYLAFVGDRRSFHNNAFVSIYFADGIAAKKH